MVDHQQLLSPLCVRGLPKYLSFVSHGYVESAVYTFAELGIADLLATADKPPTADELASSQGWNTDYLYRILRTVADADILHEIKPDNGKEEESLEPEKTSRFELTEDGRLLESNHPSKARYMLLLELGQLTKSTSFYLPQLVREGNVKGNGFQQTTQNQTMFEYMKDPKNHNFAHAFNEAMTSYSSLISEAIANTVDFSPFSILIDIGGNLGVLLANILAKYSSIKQGICFDLPHVVEQSEAGREFEKHKVASDRYRFVGGDMFDPKTIPQGDAYILQNIVHDWNNDCCIEFLKAIRTAAKGQPITLFIAGLVILPQTDKDKLLNWQAHALDIHMLKALDAKERTQKQHEHLLEQSGFTFKRLHRTATPFSIIEATANY